MEITKEEFDQFIKNSQLMDQLLDDRIELFGCNNTIQYLINSGYTAEDLKNWNFDSNDIIKAMEEDEDE